MMLLLLAGCGGGQRWYKAGGSGVDFAGDSQECEIVASELSRQAGLTGRREEPEAYILAFDNCLYAKGWSTLPAAPASLETAAAETPSPLAVYHQNGTIETFGRAFAIPPGFALEADSLQGFGPTLMQSLVFAGPDSTFLNFTIQKSFDRKFEATNYPAQEPFFLYERGRDGRRPDRLRWTVFTGNIQESWVAGLGGYLLLGPHERLTIVITMPLPDPREPIPAGLRLSHGQFQAVEEFREEWLPWLQKM